MPFINQIQFFRKKAKYRRFLFLVTLLGLFLILIQLISSFFNKPETTNNIRYLETIPPQAQQVKTGIFALNVYDFNISSHTYYLDFYIWFKWKGEIDPTENLELSNGVEQWGMSSVPIYPEPEKLPDGSYYQIWRVNSRFVQSLNLHQYPLDHHSLNILVENYRYTIDQLVYLADSEESGYSDDLFLPDWKIRDFNIANMVRDYPTNFSDPRMENNHQYSVIQYSLNIDRHLSFFIWKLLLPLIIVIAVSWSTFLLNPQNFDSRITLPVTCLLTSVFLQQSYSANLPDIGYLVLLDKIYVIVYILIFISILEAIITTDLIQDKKLDHYDTIIKIDRLMLTVQPIILLVSIVLIVILT